MSRIAVAIVLAWFFIGGCRGETLPEYLRKAGFTELHIAASGGDVARVRTLVQAGAKVNVASDSGITPLHSAAMKGQADAVRTLVELGAELEARDQHGRTPLFVAAEIAPQPARVLDALIASGANLHAKDKFGKTPLQAAWKPEAREVLAAHEKAASSR